MEVAEDHSGGEDLSDGEDLSKEELLRLLKKERMENKKNKDIVKIPLSKCIENTPMTTVPLFPKWQATVQGGESVVAAWNKHMIE